MSFDFLSKCQQPLAMKVIATDLPGVLILEPKVSGDERGFFMEIYCRDDYVRQGIPRDLAQDNLS